MSENIDLPDFKIPHAEKIEWMIETSGWALEPVAASIEGSETRPGYSYTIGVWSAYEFPELVIFGLTPVACKGLIDLVLDQVVAGVDIPLDVALRGLLDNDLRCVFSSVDMAAHAEMFATALKWNKGAAVPMVQLLWPDRHGWLPFEAAFDQKMTSAQPIIGHVPEL